MVYTIRYLKHGNHICPGPEMFYLQAWDEKIPVTFYVWILEGNGKVILVDTGIRDVGEINPAIIRAYGKEAAFFMDEEESIPVQLAAVGIQPEDVDYVFLTHLHYDHASNVKLFPRARIVISRRGWVETLAPRHPFMDSGFFPRDVLAYLVNEAWDRLYLAQDREEVLPGVEVCWVGGHTPCSQFVKVATAKGAAILAGDTIFLYDNIERNIPIGLTYNVIECMEAMDLAHREGDIVLPGHDVKIAERYPDGFVC